MNLIEDYQTCPNNMNKEQLQEQQPQHEHPCLFSFSKKRHSIIDRGKLWVSIGIFYFQERYLHYVRAIILYTIILMQLYMDMF